MSYCGAQDLLNRFDARTVGDLVNDAGQRQTVSELVGPPVNTVLQAALDDGAGLINAACQVGERYTQAELAALTGTDQAILFRLNCDLAFVYLAQRRGLTPPGYKEAYDRSSDLLEKLKQGELIFNVPGDVGEGVPSMEFPSMATYNTVGLLRDRAVKAFPLRRKMEPATGGYNSNG
jgi:phage gp36-like protein